MVMSFNSNITLKKPEAIVFDWDNTLVNTWPVIYKSLRETYIKFDKQPLTLEEVMANVKYSLRDSFPIVFGDHWEDARDVFYNNFETHHIIELETIEGAQDFLEFLGDLNIPLSLVSNKTGKYLRKEAEYLNWSSYFHRIIGAGDAAQDKPAVDPLHLALEGGNVKLSESVWFIGDSEVDIQIAENAKCTGILLHFEDKPEDMKANPHQIHPTFNSLISEISKYF